MLLAGLIAYVVFAAPIQTYTVLTAQQIQNHVLYQQSILKHDMQGRAISVQPFDAGYLPETKYGGEVEDHNALLIPDVISKPTLQGEHISEYKQRQIAGQTLASPTIPNATQLKPMEEH
jgi:multicomponent K+:H+ antiporter subunit D